MQLRFTWKSPHEALEVLAASINGRPIGADARVTSGGSVEVEDRLLAEGATHELHLHLSVPELRGKPLTGLSVTVEWTHVDRPPLPLVPEVTVSAAPAVTHVVRRLMVPWSWM